MFIYQCLSGLYNHRQVYVSKSTCNCPGTLLDKTANSYMMYVCFVRLDYVPSDIYNFCRFVSLAISPVVFFLKSVKLSNFHHTLPRIFAKTCK